MVSLSLFLLFAIIILGLFCVVLALAMMLGDPPLQQPRWLRSLHGATGSPVFRAFMIALLASLQGCYFISRAHDAQLYHSFIPPKGPRIAWMSPVQGYIAGGLCLVLAAVEICIGIRARKRQLDLTPM